ncbi:trichohyalin isoform X3 [Scaptodrosophila lebanonensis]|uniref:Trichohyalin isoform X3 n=1 Tax=Drosophila lebanonensis TaxID=7225 RepID=A0A6J2UAI8_DROLE|nr:trichohyalin isoform X3 [Scaptodrosophila lebanonensis]
MAADEALAGIGELVFSLVVGYFGALEFVFVARQLYHWTFQHNSAAAALDAAADSQELPRLRERLNDELDTATAREQAAGTQVMQDGVAYSNGFRVDPSQMNPMSSEKREALEEELERQRRIEKETRKQLAEAEARLAEERKIAEQQRKAAEEAEAAENARKLIEAEQRREAEQRQREEIERQEREENERKLKEAEQQQREEIEQKLREAEQREREENERKLLAAEHERQEAERQRELAEAENAEQERKLFEAEHLRQQNQADLEKDQELRDAEIVERLLAAERERKLSATESELEEEELMAQQARRLLATKTQLEQKQKLIEENARKFLEAEEEMVVLQQRMLESIQDSEYSGQTPVVEEPCIKRIVPPKFEETLADEPLVVQKVKTQFGQSSSGEEPYATKTLIFPGVSDEGSSVEPNSSQQSSFSTQPSEELTAEALRAHLETERQEPDGEDNVPDMQYTEDYLRSLDGIKNRPLVREDGSGRRRAFKKRRSSGSSNSSRDSRASREEELKMFTSLEEEELRKGDKDDYNPIKYGSEPTLRVKSHHRRHKRSPAKDIKSPSADSSSLEMLGEESTNPWGEVVPEHYKDTEFWKREKALSIDEEELELEKRASGEEVVEEEATANNVPKVSSFEEATEAQNAQAASALKEQLTKEKEEGDSVQAPQAAENKSNT